MAFRSLRVYNFRNLRNTTLSTESRQVLLVGDNGQGKTNLLEAIYYVCYASSFRTRRDDVLRRQNESEMAVEAAFAAEGEEHTILVKQSGRSKEILLDKRQVSDRKDIIANVPCIVFCHDDISFAGGPPEMQRWFFNQTQSLVDRDYVEQLRIYGRVLRHRNAALRDGTTELLDVFDEQLAEAGVVIQQKRRSTSALFGTRLHELFGRVFQDDRELTLHYQPSWQTDPERESVAGVLKEVRRSDIDLRTTTRGPHRDRFRFQLDGRPLAEVASTGQLRLVSLMLRVSQAQLLAEQSGRRPVLLLDDVLLELDPDRRRRFLEALPDYEQAFFTFLPDDRQKSVHGENPLMYHVHEGTLEKS